MDLRFMFQALDLAAKGRGLVSPNPCVGAVIVKGGEVISTGWHGENGVDHAELVAISSANTSFDGCDLYVTLEPCCHHGKTPPCTDAILSSGISRVFVGMLDPFSEVNGKGIEILRAAGVEVFVCDDLDLVKAISLLNQGFLKSCSVDLPYVVMKSAVTLDGRIATASGESNYITGTAARDDARAERSFCDAVLVGSGTILSDNPELSALNSKKLLRVIVGRELDLPLDLKVFRDENVMYFVNDDSGRDKYEASGVRIFKCKGVEEILIELFNFGVRSVFVEGGGGVHGSFFDAFLENNQLIDRVVWYVSPKFIGGGGISAVAGTGVDDLDFSKSLIDVKCSMVGGDVKIEGYFNFR